MSGKHTREFTPGQLDDIRNLATAYLKSLHPGTPTDADEVTAAADRLRFSLAASGLDLTPHEAAAKAAAMFIPVGKTLKDMGAPDALVKTFLDGIRVCGDAELGPIDDEDDEDREEEEDDVPDIPAWYLDGPRLRAHLRTLLAEAYGDLSHIESDAFAAGEYGIHGHAVNARNTLVQLAKAIDGDK